MGAGRAGVVGEFPAGVSSRCDVEYGARAWEIFARLARARVLRTLDGAAARSEIESSLDRADDLVVRTGARAFIGLIREERARLADVLGDEEGLAAAKRKFTEASATGHAERLARELDA